MEAQACPRDDPQGSLAADEQLVEVGPDGRARRAAGVHDVPVGERDVEPDDHVLDLPVARRVLPRAPAREPPTHRRQVVTGLVVNARPAVARREYDALRALLHNCARTGPAAQNHDAHPAFREHLLGRIAWVGTGRPTREARLRALFAAIPL